MVTRAGKKLLRNTIHTVDHHNKVLEEQDMWRQWELQQALTMMVSDDAIRSHAKYLRRKDKSKGRHKAEDKSTDADLHKEDVESLKRMRNYWLNKLMEAEEKDPDRWGHSGFKELYPEEFEITTLPEHSQTKSGERKKEKKKKKHKRKISRRSSTSSNSSGSYTRNSRHCENNSTDKQSTVLSGPKKVHEETLESTDSTDYEGENSKKLKRKHYSLNKSAKSKKRHKRYKTSKKSQNHKKYKKARHNSESSVEEIWVERTIENRGNAEMPLRSSSTEMLQKPSYVNSISSDNMENNFLIDSQTIQNKNLSHS